jgi:DNA-binding FrmR family transcriptional regulator
VAGESVDRSQAFDGYYTPLYYWGIVTHTLQEKRKLLNRVRRIKGQVEAIERALEAEADCADVMQQITSCRGAVNGLLAEVLEEHITSHFASTAANKQASEQLLDVVHMYFK